MHITHCLMSCDSNTEYLEFWPVAAKAWLKLGIRPVLFYIATDEKAHPEEVADCPVHVFAPLPDIAIKIQASTLRYWGCTHYPENTVIISDIDLIPLSKRFFIDRLREVDENAYVHVPPIPRPEYGRLGPQFFQDQPIEHADYLNAIYHIGRGEVMRRVLGLSDSWEADCRALTPYWYKIKGHRKILPPDLPMDPAHVGHHGDEIGLSIRVALAKQQGRDRIELLPYSEAEFARADSNFNSYKEDKLRAGQYPAILSPRPYSKHRETLHTLMALHDSSSPQPGGEW